MNEFVGSGQQRFRDGQAERLRGLKVEHHFEAGRLLDRQFAGFLAFEDAADVFADYALAVCCNRCVTHEPTGEHEFASEEGRWQREACCRCDKFI